MIQSGRKPSGGEDGPRGDTRSLQDDRRAPKLPHEHDESADSQRAGETTAPAVGKQAYRDLQEGREDTDRGPVVDRLKAQEDAGESQQPREARGENPAGKAHGLAAGEPPTRRQATGQQVRGPKVEGRPPEESAGSRAAGSHKSGTR